LRRYAIVSAADQRAAVEKLERARTENSRAENSRAENSRAENSPYFGPYSTETDPSPAPGSDVKVQ
jgi:hypothetical protein